MPVTIGGSSPTVQMSKIEHWDGIPGRWIDDSTALDGRRFVASDYGFNKLRARLRTLAQYRCELCGRYCPRGDLHHVYGRGLSGGKREDRWKVGTERFLKYLCRICHEVQVIKPWGSWQTHPEKATVGVSQPDVVTAESCGQSLPDHSAR